LTEKEAFALGFVQRCVADGLSPTQIADRVKQAEDVIQSALHMAEKRAGLIDGTANALGNMASTAIPFALAAPPIVGGLGGYALSRATDVDDTDVEDIKTNEIIDTYRAEAEKLRRAKQLRASKAQPSGRVRGYYG